MKTWKWWMLIVLVGCFFFLLSWQGRIDFQIGKKGIQSTSGDTYVFSEITGQLLVSPYGVEKELLDIFAQTRYQVRMWDYLITEKTFLSMFSNLGQIGKHIQIILENEVYGGDHDAFDKAKKKLEQDDVQIISDEKMGTNFVHAKTMIIDDDTFIIATANFTYPSLWRNREYRFVGENKDIIRSLSSIFDKDFEGEKLRKQDIDRYLYVCPIDCREKISDALKDAEKSIEIETQYIEDEEIIRILEQQKSQRVRVQVIVGKYQEEGVLDILGTGVKMIYDPYIHAKNILIDGKILIMGSANLSENALDNNREIGIIIDDPWVVKKFKGQFERDWDAKD